MSLPTLLLPMLLVLGGERYVHEGPAFELELPSDAWKAQDHGGGGVVALVFSPVADLTTRCSVLRFPRSFLPEGLETREGQIAAAAGAAYALVSKEPGRIAGRDATRWEYTVAGATTIEWVFDDGDADLVFFQVAAPKAAWEDETRRSSLVALADSFRWTGGATVESSAQKTDQTPPEQVRTARANATPPTRAVDVAKHRIEVRIDPDLHSLAATDTLSVVAIEEGVTELTLYTSVVEVVEVKASVPLNWSSAPGAQADELVLTFERSLPVGEEVTVTVQIRSDDYFLGTDQQLVSEISVLGQVRPDSSWSSHVVWYPIAAHNDAAMDITLDVPESLVAITGGELREATNADGRARFRYVEEERCERILPFGFAVGDYVHAETESEGGLHLHVYGFAGEDKRIAQRVEVLRECADAFERALGPLPWSHVRFVHVRPSEKETGVSLPGMILVSDAYFPDLEDVDGSSGNLSDPNILGLLVVADELSHQWNIYAAGFPNELGEGVSTYTNALFLELRHGVDAYRKTIRYCRDAWIRSAGSAVEYAIANPAVYSNTRYRPVVFCKTPVVLDALRRELGDETFFAGMRAAFAVRDPQIDGFDRMQSGFEEASGVDLGDFFDQWFFRAGFPMLEVDHRVEGAEAVVTVTQTQDGDPYALDVEVLVTLADGETVRAPLALREREHTIRVPIPASAEVDGVALGPLGVLPAHVVAR